MRISGRMTSDRLWIKHIVCMELLPRILYLDKAASDATEYLLRKQLLYIRLTGWIETSPVDVW
jgi:hypothetical protein